MRWFAHVPVLCSWFFWAVSGKLEPFTPGLPQVDLPLPSGSAPPTDYRNDYCTLQTHGLEGLNVSVLIHAFADEKVDTQGRFTQGFFLEVFDEMARRGGFRWHAWSATLNATLSRDLDANDILVWGTEHYDVVLGAYSATALRKSKGLRFGFPLRPSSPQFVVRLRNTADSLWSLGANFLKPFTWRLWLTILASFVFTAILYSWVEGESADIEGMSRVQAFAQSLFLSVGSFTGANGFAPATRAGKVAIIGWTFVVLLLTSSYTAELASILVEEGGKASVVTSVAEAVRRGLPICVEQYTKDETLMRTNFPEARLKLFPSETRPVTKLLQEKKCVGLIQGHGGWDELRGQSAENPDCKFGVVGQSFTRLEQSFVSKASTADPGNHFCTDKLQDELDRIAQAMYQEHFIEEKREVAYRNTWDMEDCEATDKPEQHNDDFLALDVQHMSGIFIVYLVIALVSCCVIDDKARNKTQDDIRAYTEQSDEESSDSHT